MLKGKKKVLAAQIALALMVAGQAQLMDYSVASADADYTVASVADSFGTDAANCQVDGTTLKVGDYGSYRTDYWLLLGTAGKFPGAVVDDAVKNKTIEIKASMAYWYDSSASSGKPVISAKEVTGNTIKFATDQIRNISDYATTKTGILKNIFSECENDVISKNNTLELNMFTVKTGAADAVTSFDVGAENDIVVKGGKGADYVNHADGTLVDANYSQSSFAGRNLTITDGAGASTIKSADMKGKITSTASTLTASGDLKANEFDVKGVTANQITAAGKIKATDNINSTNALNAGDSIEAAAITAKGISAKSINATGDITSADAINVNELMKTTGDVSAVGKSINAGSISAVNVTADSVTLSNGASEITNTLTTDKLNISGSSKLDVKDLTNVTAINVTSDSEDYALKVTGTINGGANKLSDFVKSGAETQKRTMLLNRFYTMQADDAAGTVSSKHNRDEIVSQAKSLVETQVASLTQVMGSAELLASSGYVNASQAVKDAKAEGDSSRAMVPYAAVGYGNLKQNSGSYVNTKSFQANVGFAKEVENKQGKLLFGPFIEYGRGNYDSHLDDGTSGDGTAQNYGLGFMARQDNKDGLYYEGSIRFGKTTSNYNSNNMWAGHNVHYDNSANYWGVHAGVGKVQKLNDKNSIDYYAKLFHTNVGGSSVNIDGDNVSFSSTRSTRSLIGARFIHKTSDVRSIYAGLAWQQEYAGDAKATSAYGDLPSPSIKGASAMAELGIMVAPSQSPLSFDLGVKGWAGKQQGYSFNAKMNWKF